MQHQFDLAGVQLELQLDPELPLVVCDGAQIEQVLLALVMNALDAMPQGGQLTLATKNSHDFKNGNTPGVRILIADTGYGIAADQQKKVNVHADSNASPSLQQSAPDR